MPERPGSPTGTTRCSTLAAVITAARTAALARGCVATVGKVSVEPNGVNAIASRVTAWLDARGADQDAVQAVVAEVAAAASVAAAQESFTRAPPTSTLLSRRGCPHCSATRPSWPPAPAMTPASWLLPASRRPCCSCAIRPGVSHSPDEFAETADCLAGVDALDRSTRKPGGMTYFADYARLPAGVARNVRFEIADGRFASVETNTEPGDAHRLPGIVLPGFANAHSHAFHRALRGRTHNGGGTFWTWRERMYARRRPARPRLLSRRSPAPRMPRWRWPGSRRSGSSTTCTTRPVAFATTIRTRWPKRCARRPPTPVSG